MARLHAIGLSKVGCAGPLKALLPWTVACIQEQFRAQFSVVQKACGSRPAQKVQMGRH